MADTGVTGLLLVHDMVCSCEDDMVTVHGEDY